MDHFDDIEISKVVRSVEGIGIAVARAGVSPNESDRNGEEANVVDGLFAMARAIDRLARAVEGVPRTKLRSRKVGGK